jgi:hypothetical protein
MIGLRQKWEAVADAWNGGVHQTAVWFGAGRRIRFSFAPLVGTYTVATGTPQGGTYEVIYSGVILPPGASPEKVDKIAKKEIKKTEKRLFGSKPSPLDVLDSVRFKWASVIPPRRNS